MSQATPSIPPSRLGVLRHEQFRWVWTAALFSSIGTWMEQTGAQWLITEATGSSQMVGFLGAAQMLPSLMLGLVAGVIADRIDRKRMLLWSQAVMMVVAGTLTTLAFLGLAAPHVLIALAFINGTAMCFNISAWTTLTPRLVPREDLGRAIALNSLQFNLARIVGPAIAGQVIAMGGPPWVFALNTMSFLGVLMAVARTEPSPPAEQRGNPVEALKEALAFVFKQRGPLAVLAGICLFALLAVPMRHQIPVFVQNVYGLDADAFGLMLGVMGAGAVSGGLVLQMLPSTLPRRRLIPASMLAAGVSIAFLASANSVYVAAPILFLSGWFWLWTFSSSWSAIQLLVPDRMRGRVMSINTTFMFGCMALGNVIVGTAGDRIGGREGPQLAVGGAAVVLILASIVMLVLAPKEVDGEAGE